jgi:hypothetical protein
MINFNEQLSQTDAQWVLEQVFPVFSHRIAHPTLSKLMEGHNKVFREQVGVAGCSCEYKAQHAMWHSRLDQYKSQIEERAYPKVEEVVVEVGEEIQSMSNEIQVKTRKSRK